MAQRKPLTDGLSARAERLRMMAVWQKRSSCLAGAVEHGEAPRSGEQSGWVRASGLTAREYAKSHGVHAGT
jgi:hypothetical protein